ncbi:GyrI-like domain-containing protein [Amycolatopsis sp. NPDC051758]|uniref:GyrI-like domain-containing protein n=1 Tax=Amycolatopsis sp. NPDC051758 TaxID=3363935 RepID=UPI0037B59BD6
MSPEPPVTASVLSAPPARIHRSDVVVMEQTAADELPAIQALWPAFERVVGLRGRKMFARADERAGTYTVCTPVKPGDRPEELGLRTGVLPGGWYLRGTLVGAPELIYGRIAGGMAELRRAAPLDETRPLVEFYRRHGHIELWLPVEEHA